MFPEINALGTGKEREVAALVPTPGLRLLLTLSDSPTRGMWTASNGEFYVVAGQNVYSISSSWVATDIGTINTATGPVSMADNGTHLIIVDGTDGWSWNMSTDTFERITDPDFLGADQVTYLDGYFIFNKPNSQQFYFTDINAITFDALDIASAEGSPDYLVGLIVNNQNLFLFGERSTEVFYNSGDANAPFSRIQGAVIDVGCAAPFSIARAAGMIFFIGGDSTGSGIVYKLQGFQNQRISTPAIEKIIRSMSADDITSSTAFTYQQGGHIFYCLNLTGENSTWVYDATTEFWHERAFLNLWSLERHRAQYHTIAFGENVVGDYENGKIYSLDPDTYSDNGASISRIRRAPHISKNLKQVTHHSFQIDMETGVGLDGTTQGTNPQVSIRWSDDGGHTWSNEYWTEIGAIGKRKTRAIWRRLGMSRDRVYEIKISDPVKVVLIGAELDVEEGTS